MRSPCGLGWLGALLAALTAYVRVFGGSLGFAQDFRGPLAKQQRMAVLTVACVVGAGGTLACAARWALTGRRRDHRRRRSVTCITRTRAIGRAAAREGGTAMRLRRAGILVGRAQLLVGAQPRWIGSRARPRRCASTTPTTPATSTRSRCGARCRRRLRAKTRPVAARDYWSGAGCSRYIATRGFNALFIERSADRRDGDPLAPLVEALHRGEIADHLSRRHAPRAGAAESRSRVDCSTWPQQFPAGRTDPGLSRQSVSQHAQGHVAAGAADLLGAFRRALERRVDEAKDAFLERARQASWWRSHEHDPQQKFYWLFGGIAGAACWSPR